MNSNRVCESNPSLLPPPSSPPSIGTLFQTFQAAKNENLEMLLKMYPHAPTYTMSSKVLRTSVHLAKNTVDEWIDEWI